MLKQIQSYRKDIETCKKPKSEEQNGTKICNLTKTIKS